MGIKFNEALNNDLVSQELVKIIGDKCRCNREIEFSNSIKKVICTYDKCKYKIIDRVDEFCKEFNIPLHYNNIVYLVEKLNITTPYQILILNEAYDNKLISSSNIDNILDVIERNKEILSKEYELHEIISHCGIKEISNISEAIFSGFNSVEEAYNEIEHNQIAYISERLGISDTDSNIFSVDIYNKLIDIKDEFLFMELKVKIKKDNRKKIFIAFDDTVSTFINKSEYIEYLNSLNKNIQFIHIVGISNNTDVLIHGSGSANTNKYKTANIINDAYAAELINNGSISMGNINKDDENSIKPIGSKILICDENELLKRVIKLYGE